MKPLIPVVALAALVGGPVARGQDAYGVLLPVVYDVSAPLADSLRGCNPDKLVGDQVVVALGKRYPGTRAVARPADAPGRTVNLTILSLQGAGGGAWSGAKSITLRAELFQGGAKVASQTFVRNSRGGVLGGVSGSCPIVEKITGALAEDVSVWVSRQGTAVAPAGERLLVQVPAQLAAGVQIREQIKAECAVETKFRVHAFERLQAGGRPAVQSENPDPAGADKLLRLTIVEFGVLGIGVTSDKPQTVRVRADLIQGGKVYASREFERDGSSGAGFGATTCEYIERISQRVGQDLAGWLWKDRAFYGEAGEAAAAPAKQP